MREGAWFAVLLLIAPADVAAQAESVRILTFSNAQASEMAFTKAKARVMHTGEAKTRGGLESWLAPGTTGFQTNGGRESGRAGQQAAQLGHRNMQESGQHGNQPI